MILDDACLNYFWGGKLNLVWIFVVSFLRLFIRKVSGIENTPKDKNFIVASNHSSYLDPFIIATVILLATERYTRFLALRSGRGFVVGERVSRSVFKAIPLGEDKEKAFSDMLHVLKKGKDCVGIFPEGPRSLDGRLKKGKTGVIRLAIKSKKPILPFGLIGTYEIAPREKIIPKLRRCELSIGKPIYFDEYYNKKITRALLRKLTDDLMAEIAGLTGKKYSY